MNKMFSGALTGLTAIACALSAVPASAQDDHRYDRDRGGDRHDNGGDRHDNNGGGGWNGRGDNRDNRGGGQQYRWNNYGGRYGYNGYHGRWRTGQRYSHWNDNRYYVSDYGRYNLPPPRAGYRYYREDNGDIVMAAVATGVIGLILGSQLGR